MAATDWLRRLASFGQALAGAVLAGGAVAPAANAAVLPEDHAELLLHDYDGGGVRATGPALLVRKSIADKVSLSGQYYVDAVSNASIDVVTTASPFRETRKALGFGAETVVRDSTVGLWLDRSREPDYIADTLALDVTQDVFAGMTTVSLGFTRGSDDVGKKGVGFFDEATHWQYRAGVTQILSPRWLASLNFEAIADEGYLGSPYRVARVFGTTVPENVPRTRSSRAIKASTVGTVGDAGARTALRAEYRHYWDTWDIGADTLEFGASHYFGERWLADATLRWYTQSKAIFYSDDATTETLYISRNRQLGTFKSLGLGAKLSYRLDGAAAKYGVRLVGSYEFKQFDYSDFTDVRTGELYSFHANVLQLFVTANY